MNKHGLSFRRVLPPDFTVNKEMVSWLKPEIPFPQDPDPDPYELGYNWKYVTVNIKRDELPPIKMYKNVIITHHNDDGELPIYFKMPKWAYSEILTEKEAIKLKYLIQVIKKSGEKLQKNMGIYGVNDLGLYISYNESLNIITEHEVIDLEYAYLQYVKIGPNYCEIMH